MSQPLTSQSAGQKNGLAQAFPSKEGLIELKVSRDAMPEFLIKANEAVNAGCIEEAKVLLSASAVEAVRQMAEKNPSQAETMYLVLAMVFQKTAQLKKAEKWYKKILERGPNGLVLNELAGIYRQTGNLSKMMQYRKRAVEIDPDNLVIGSGFAADIIAMGQLEEGIDLLRKLLEKNPTNSSLHSKILWYMHYLPDQDPQLFFEEHKRWGQMHTPISLAKTSHNNVAEPDRKLRVGYISPDFREHSVAYNFEPFLSGRNREAVEVYGYGSVSHPDRMTERLKQQFDHYRNIRSMSDEEAAHLIEEDRIDILVEIGSHVNDHRLGVLGYKPAPVQVDFGGINTTGMEQIDYRLTDGFLHRPELQQFYTEELIYLPDGFMCYTPPHASPAVASLPAKQNGYITFGSFNGSLKINESLIRLWADILRANDNSRFLMKFGVGGDSKIVERYLAQFEQLGVSRERIQICGWKSALEHLQLYNQIDIALDTYPYNGCITTLEGLWMGVPTVSLVGRDNYVSRVGLSILSRLDLEFFAALTPEEYVAKSVALAQNPDALAKIRASMRQRMVSSTLCDAKGYATNVEAAYRQMWRRWCQGHTKDRVDLPAKKNQQGPVTTQHTTAQSGLKAKRIFVSTMPRSGSRWTYNVTRALIEGAGIQPIPRSMVIADDLPFVIKAFKEPPGENEVYCVKTHHAINFKQSSGTLLITTYRDIRDVVVSYMKFMRASFEYTIRGARASMKLADTYLESRAPNVLGIRYDEIVNQPLDTIQKIDHFIGTGVCIEVMEEINRRFCKENIRQRLERLDNMPVEQYRQDDEVEVVQNVLGNFQIYDKSTGFQKGHITSNKDGQWREVLTEEQQRILMRETSDWLKKYGFPL